jgi:autotransporter translocation and assembly factor TamB
MPHFSILSIKNKLKQCNLSGHFTTGRSNRPANYKLEIRDFSCLLDKKSLEGQLMVQDFNSYKIDLILKGEADVNSLVLLFPGNLIKTAFGTVKMNVHLNGDIQNPKLSKNFNADGDVTLRNVSFVLNGERLPFNKINGTMSLRKNDLAISNLSGAVGKSDFSLNGFFKDISGLIMKKNNPVRLQADLRSSYIDFDELLMSNFASRDTMQNSKYEFAISPDISIDFNCEIDKLKFRRFRGSDIKGQLDIDNQIAVLKNISFSSMGGRINISGSVNNKNPNLVETITEANL